MSGWTDAEEEKPDADELVLVFTPDTRSEPIWIGYYDDEQGSWFMEDGFRCRVTHWMGLPEAPKTAEVSQ